jgi:hypothetical protein
MSDRVTGDDNAYCAICGHVTSLAMISTHLVEAHGYDPEEIASAPRIEDQEDRPEMKE